MLPSDALVAKMRAVHDRNGYINCRLAVQLTINYSKIEDLPRIKFDDLEIGDVIAWGHLHFALWIGYGQIVQVGGWGEPVTVQDFRSACEYWGQPTRYYRSPPMVNRDEE